MYLYPCTTLNPRGAEPPHPNHARGAGSRARSKALSVQALFSDRSDGINSINRYAEDLQATATNAVFIAVPARREAHACRGPADRGEWARLSFA